jgi:hypothetical protein
VTAVVGGGTPSQKLKTPSCHSIVSKITSETCTFRNEASSFSFRIFSERSADAVPGLLLQGALERYTVDAAQTHQHRAEPQLFLAGGRVHRLALAEEDLGLLSRPLQGEDPGAMAHVEEGEDVGDPEAGEVAFEDLLHGALTGTVGCGRF